MSTCPGAVGKQPAPLVLQYIVVLELWIDMRVAKQRWEQVHEHAGELEAGAVAIVEHEGRTVCRDNTQHGLVHEPTQMRCGQQHHLAPSTARPQAGSRQSWCMDRVYKIEAGPLDFPA